MSFSGKNAGCLSTKENDMSVEALMLTALWDNPVSISLKMSMLIVDSGLKEKNTLM